MSKWSGNSDITAVLYGGHLNSMYIYANYMASMQIIYIITKGIISHQYLCSQTTAK